MPLEHSSTVEGACQEKTGSGQEFQEPGNRERGHTSSVTALAGDAPRHLLLQEKAWGTGEPPHPSRRLRGTRRDTFSSRRRLGAAGTPIGLTATSPRGGSKSGDISSAPVCRRAMLGATGTFSSRRRLGGRGSHLICHGACGRRAATPSPPGEGLGDGGATSSVTALAGDAPRHLLLKEKAWGRAGKGQPAQAAALARCCRRRRK